MKKQDKETFLREAVAILEHEGARRVEGHLDAERWEAFELETAVGRLTADVEREPKGGCTVFCRFEDVGRAATLGLNRFNPHSGKYNFHAGAKCDVVEAFRNHVGRACEGMTLPVRQSGSVM